MCDNVSSNDKMIEDLAGIVLLWLKPFVLDVLPYLEK